MQTCWVRGSTSCPPLPFPAPAPPSALEESCSVGCTSSDCAGLPRFCVKPAREGLPAIKNFLSGKGVLGCVPLREICLPLAPRPAAAAAALFIHPASCSCKHRALACPRLPDDCLPGLICCDRTAEPAAAASQCLLQTVRILPPTHNGLAACLNLDPPAIPRAPATRLSRVGFDFPLPLPVC